MVKADVQSPGFKRNVMVMFLLDNCNPNDQVLQNFKNDFVSLISGTVLKCTVRNKKFATAC